MGLVQTIQSLWDPTDEIIQQLAQDARPPEKADITLSRLRIQLGQRLGSPYPGEYRGIFKGHGMELQNLREYQPGDDVRKIDWNVLARTGVPHVKEHYEEKQVPVWFFVDATTSMGFGQHISKLAYVKEIVGLLGLMALQCGHRVGLILWQGERRPEFVNPRPSLEQLQWIIHKLDTLSQTDSMAPETEDFPDVAALMQNRCLVFVLSDFAFLTQVAHARHKLTRLYPKHQVETLLVVDPVEWDLVYHHSWLPLSDTVSKEVVWLNTNDRWLIKEYRKAFQKNLRHRRQLLSPWSRSTVIRTDVAPVEQVVNMVKSHGA